MTLQDTARNVIEKLGLELDSVFCSYGLIKTLESDTSIYLEKVNYEQGIFSYEFSACMHPHDYPNKLSMSLLYKLPYKWKHESIQNNLEAYNLDLLYPGDLLIISQNHIESTIQVVKIIMSELLLLKAHKICIDRS